MWLMYAIAMGTSVADGGIGIGTFATDWTNDVLFGEIVPNALGGLLESIGVAGWLYGLIMDGIVAGVGAVLGFVPQMLVLFFLLSILEDVATWPVSPSSWTVSSAASVCPARASSPFWLVPAAAFPVLWLPVPSRTSVTAV